MDQFETRLLKELAADLTEGQVAADHASIRSPKTTFTPDALPWPRSPVSLGQL